MLGLLDLPDSPKKLRSYPLYSPRQRVIGAALPYTLFLAEFYEGALGFRLLDLGFGKGQGMGKAGFSRRLRLRLIAHYPPTHIMYETSCVRQIGDLPSLPRLFKPRTVIIYLFDLCEPVVETT